VLVKRKEVPAPERVVTNDITVSAKKAAGTELGTNRVAVEVGVFHDQIGPPTPLKIATRFEKGRKTPN
jgi:hypothetical protein